MEGRRRKGMVEMSSPPGSSVSSRRDKSGKAESSRHSNHSNMTIVSHIDCNRTPTPNIVEQITRYPEGDDRYALFAYLDSLAKEQGADRQNYVTLHTSYKKLKSKANPDSMTLKDDYGQTALHIAVQYCSADIVSLFLNKGAAINAKDELGYTPLFYAAMSNNAVICATLIRRGADLEARGTGCHRGVLHIAAMHGSFVVIKLLLDQDKKCDINYRDDLGLTPVALAAYYRHSNVTTYLLAMGADPFLVDNRGISSAIRIAHSMPLVIRDVFDKMCTEELLKGERRYHLDKMLKTEADIKTSLFQFLVWQGNLGIVEHPFFKHLIETKWEIYGEKPTYKNFGILAIVTTIWTGLYMITTENNMIQITKKSELKYQHFIHLGVYIASFACYLQRLKMNTMLWRRRHTFLMHIRRVMRRMDKSESLIMHPKGKHLMNAAKDTHKTEKVTFINDLKKAPSLMSDFVIDHILLLYLAIKVLANFSPFFASVENMYGAIAIICLYANIFLKLQITKKIGPFVIYMKYVPSDLFTVCTMFITLFVPAVIVFYKTIFKKDGIKPFMNGTEEAEEPSNKVRRAAGKGGSGGGGDYESLDVMGTFFVVLRMVLVDYEYDDGMSRADPPVWWMIVSLTWIIVSSIIVLNLMIAIMADSYTRIYERSEISSRVRRAETIADIEKGMGPEELTKAIGGIKEKSPIKILFDPICDRGKVEIVDAKVQVLTYKLNRLEQTVNNKLFIDLKQKLDFIETKVKNQSYKQRKAASFSSYT